MARSSNMADIDTYIEETKTEDTPVTPLVDPNAPTDAVGAPEVGTDNTGAKLVPQQEEDGTTRASIQDMQRVQAEQEKQRQEESAAAQAIRQGVQGVTDNTARINATLRATLGKIASGVGSVPIPGDLLLPLSILLLFFFARIAVNGHTRLSWLWLVLSGNATITTSGGASFGTVTTGTPVTPPVTTTPVSGTPVVTPLILPFAGAGEPT